MLAGPRCSLHTSCTSRPLTGCKTGTLGPTHHCSHAVAALPHFCNENGSNGSKWPISFLDGAGSSEQRDAGFSPIRASSRAASHRQLRADAASVPMARRANQSFLRSARLSKVIATRVTELSLFVSGQARRSDLELWNVHPKTQK